MDRPARSRVSIRRKLLFAFILPLLPLFTLHVLAIAKWNAVRQQTVLRSHADAAVAVSLALREYIADLRRAAEALPVRLGRGSRVAVSRTALFALHGSYQHLISQVSVVDASGQVTSSTFRGLAGRSVGHHDYFRMLESGHDWYLTDVLRGAVGGRNVVLLAVARRDEADRLRAAVVFEIEPAKMVNAIAVLGLPGRQVMLVDRHGVLVCGSPWEVFAHKVGLDAAKHPLVSSALGGVAPQPAAYVSPFDRQRHLGCAHIVPGVGWVAVASSPSALAMKPVRSHVLSSVLGIAIAAAAAVGLAMVLSDALTRPVRALASVADRVAGGDYSARAEVPTGDELGILAVAFNQMASQVEKHVAELAERSRQIQELYQRVSLLASKQGEIISGLEKAKRAVEKAYEQERRITVALQEPLMPAIPTVLAGFEVGHLYQSASDEARVGGDFYDLLQLSDGRVMAAIGDVCGKGLAAASQAARAKYAFVRALAVGQRDPGQVLSRVNQVLYEESEEARMVTMLCALVDARSGKLLWANAGHEPALLVRKGSGEVAELLEPGYPLGVVWHAEYQVRAATFADGDILVLYTDGITEARTGGQLLATEGVSNVLRKAADRGAQEIAQMVFDAAVQFAGGRLLDDAAVVVLRSSRNRLVSAT